MPKKKAPIGVLYDSVGDSFSQKKRVSVGNVKHSGNEKDISLVKPNPSYGMYSDIDSVSGDSGDNDISLCVGNSSFFGLATNIPKARKATFNLVCGSLFGLIDYRMNKDDVLLPLFLKISLEKKWVDPKIVKFQIEVSVRKFFTLDINLSAVEGKFVTAKTQYIRKIFSSVNGFGGATTSLKFEGIIQSTFTLEKSIEMAASLAREKGIDVNSNLKRQEMRSDQAVVIIKIPMNTLKDMIVTAVSEFGEIKSIKIQLIGMWQKAMMEFAKLSQADLLASKAFLFTLPVGTIAHNFGTLLEKTGGKTCIINRSLKTDNRICCAIVGFESNNNLESAFCMELIFGGVKLSWTKMDLVWCEKCRKFGHSALKYNASVVFLFEPSRTFKRVASDGRYLQLAKLYEKKGVPISCRATFGGKSWAQVVSLAGPSDGFCFSFGSELLIDWVSGILKKLSDIELVLMATPFSVPLLATFFSLVLHLDVDMAVYNMSLASAPLLLTVNDVILGSSLSFFKILTSKMNGLESKMVAFEVSISLVLDSWVLGIFQLVNKFNNVHVFCSGLDSDHVGAGVAIVMNRSLAKHVYKVSEISGRFLCIKLLFKNKLSVLILGLYADSFHKCASFKKCHDLDLVNFLGGSFFAKHDVFIVSKYFDMDYRAVSVSLGLDGLLDAKLNSFHKQANKDRWKFNFKSANKIKWNNFKSSTLTNATMFSGEFTASVRFLDLDAIWCVMHKVMTLLANKIFKKKWFKEFDEVFTRNSSKFHRLELLISKIVKVLHEEDAENFVYLMKCWSSVDNVKSSVVQNLVDSGAGSDHICSALFGVRKSYCASKLTESLRAKEANIKSAINKRMESFEVNKNHTIRSVLEHPFRKVVLDHLVSVLNMLLVILNLCLSDELVSGSWKEAWVSMIPKSYEWESVLTNICLIVLIEMACKILSKVLSDRISLACSAFDGLCGDNFSVLKSITTQSPIFTIGLVNMRKAYDSVGWKHLKNSLIRIKMCSKFIHFFGNIHNNYTNWVMTDFSLTDGYCHQESICRYRLNFHFISKNGHAESWAEHSSFFAAGTFVDDAIWVGSNQSAIQHILNVASEFFQINNISINNDKTVVILINSRINNPSLSISGLPISITKKEEFYRYLGIFLLTEGLFKPSLVKAYLDVCFFTNLVLKKAVSDKQFLYLVLVVLYLIVNALICKGLKLKFGLPQDFPSDTIHHPSFYGLKSFLQCQSESKIALLISFANSGGILGHLFSYRSHNLQLSLGGFLASSFQFYGGVPMFVVLGESLFYKFLSSLWHYGIVFVNQLHDCYGSVFSWHIFKQWKRLDPYGLVLEWFELSVAFFVAPYSSSSTSASVNSLDICCSDDFVFVCNRLSWVGTNSLSVYTDGSLKNLGTIGCRAGAAVFFEDINLDLGVGVQSLVSSTLTELWAIALALECMLVACSVYLFSDN
ncbi:hypothetical protein G9A89_017541 [Geosiphon pyriformis]|nr:hypothetical protein G9A89_017541 [Geosiphon pyriformis]